MRRPSFVLPLFALLFACSAEEGSILPPGVPPPPEETGPEAGKDTSIVDEGVDVAPDDQGIDGTPGDASDTSVPPPDVAVDVEPIDAGDGPVVTTLGATNRFRILGTVVTPGGAIAGEVLVKDDRIVCVAASCATHADAAGATVIDTKGIVLPGLIDTHNHVLYNVYDHADWSPPAGKLYNNVNGWQAEASYKTFKTSQYNPLESSVPCEMQKYGELKGIMGGTTAMVGHVGTDRKCYGSLARTLDTNYGDLPEVHFIRTNTLGIDTVDATEATTYKSEFASGKTKAYLVHLAEGVKGTIRKEFDKLESLGMLVPQVAIVHGTDLLDADLTKVASAGMKLVWSPRSNVVLYGDTTRIDLARAKKITIAIAPDWSISGSVNMLDELRYAQAWDKAKWGGTLTSKELFEMATVNAAKVVALEKWLGTIEVGKLADLLVIGGDATKPYDALLAVTPRDVRMTMVNGKILFGDEALQKAAPSTPCEGIPVCGRPKFVCVSEGASAPDKLNQTHADIEAALAPAKPLAPLATCP